MNNKRKIFWMNLVLVFSLIAGLMLPATNVSAATKQKDAPKVLVVYFSGTGTTASQKIRIPLRT